MPSFSPYFFFPFGSTWFFQFSRFTPSDLVSLSVCEAALAKMRFLSFRSGQGSFGEFLVTVPGDEDVPWADGWTHSFCRPPWRPGNRWYPSSPLLIVPSFTPSQTGNVIGGLVIP